MKNTAIFSEPSQKFNKDAVHFHFVVRLAAIIVAVLLIGTSEYQKNIDLFVYGTVAYLMYVLFFRFVYSAKYNTKVIIFNLYIDVLLLSTMIGFRGGLRSDFFLGYFLILGYVLLIRDKYLLIRLSLWIALTFTVAVVFFTERGEFSVGRLVIRLVLLLGTTYLLQNYSWMLNEEEALRMNASRRALMDFMTGVYNRNILKYVDELYTNIEDQLIIVMLDLDDFKLINDTYGHQKGDEVLFNLGKILNNYIYGDDLAIRYGGEEFLIIIHSTPSVNKESLIDSIKKDFKNAKYSWYKENVSISFSAGVVKRGVDETFNESVERADKLLYQAKKEGKDKIVVQVA